MSMFDLDDDFTESQEDDPPVPKQPLEEPEEEASGDDYAIG